MESNQSGANFFLERSLDRVREEFVTIASSYSNLAKKYDELYEEKKQLEIQHRYLLVLLCNTLNSQVVNNNNPNVQPVSQSTNLPDSLPDVPKDPLELSDRSNSVVHDSYDSASTNYTPMQTEAIFQRAATKTIPKKRGPQKGSAKKAKAAQNSGSQSLTKYFVSQKPKESSPEAKE